MDVRVPAVAAMVFLGLSLDSSAAINDWSAIGPSGGAVNKLVYSQDGKSAFLAAASGFYRSADGGVTWQINTATSQGSNDVEIDPADPTRIYVVSNSAPWLLVSSDGGATFAANAALPAIISANELAVSKDGATLYLNSLGRIFFSPDRGQTWQERTAIATGTLTTVFKFSIDPNDSKTLYAIVFGATSGTFATHDGAMTWQQLAPGGAGPNYDIAVNPINSNQLWSAQGDGVWVSADQGLHWSNALSDIIFSIAIDPVNPSILYAAGSYGQAFRSLNAGVNWTDVSGNISAGQNLRLAINPAQTTHLLAGGLAGVSGTSTSGTTWFSQQAGFIATNISGFSADTVADRIYVNVPNSGVFYAAGGAATTQPVNNAALFQLETIAGLPINSSFAQSGRLFASVNTGLTVSTDGGATWAPIVDAVIPATGSQQVFHMTSTAAAPQIILAASSGPITKSLDDGATWQGVAGLPNGANAYVASNLLFAPSNSSIAYSALSSPSGPLGVYKSSDAGSSWAAINSPAISAQSLLAVDPSNPSVLYGSGLATDSNGNPSLVKSIDGGVTWPTLTWSSTSATQNPNALAVDPVHPNILYAASGNRIGRSVDGGASWETLRGAAAPFWFPNALIADPKRPENLLVGTATAGTQMITIAPDLTLAVTSPASPLAIGATATYTYTATNQGPFDATGVTVQVQLPASAQSLTASAAGGSCVVTGQAATCLIPVVRKGANSPVTVTAVAPNAGAFQTTASVVGDQPDSDPSDNAVNSNATVTTISDMSVTASGNSSVHVGDAVAYTVVATNIGPNVAPAAQMTFQLAAGLTPGAVSAAGATCSSAASGQFTCNLNDLAVSKAVTVTVNATAATAGTQISTATVSSGATDLVAANNSVTATTTVTAVPPPASGGGGGGGGGGALSFYEVLALMSLLLVRRFRGLVTGSSRPPFPSCR